MLAAVIALKANAVVLAVTALIGTMDAVTLGHALAHFHVPQKLTQLMLFMVRYFDVLGREYARLRAAMRVRCFRPAMNGHSYRTFGYLVGMLLGAELRPQRTGAGGDEVPRFLRPLLHARPLCLRAAT